MKLASMTDNYFDRFPQRKPIGCTVKIMIDVIRKLIQIETDSFVWQEKYLSEHNYDEQIDEDSTLKLLNFGDDYRKFIDSMSEGDLSDHGMLALPTVAPLSPTATLPPIMPGASASTPNAKQRLRRRLRKSTTVSLLIRKIKSLCSNIKVNKNYRITFLL